MISALHKSMRNSDPDAAVYWLARMVESGEDPLYIAHDEADAVADMSCLPPALDGHKYYEPTGRGFEKEFKRRPDGWEEIKKRRRE